MIGYVMGSVNSIDIDTDLDFRLAESALEAGEVQGSSVGVQK